METYMSGTFEDKLFALLHEQKVDDIIPILSAVIANCGVIGKVDQHILVDFVVSVISSHYENNKAPLAKELN
jgi:hypothetical protein